MNLENFGLGRIEAPDDNHLQKYPLTATTLPRKPTPVVIGINWYLTFFQPVQDRNNPRVWWIARQGAPWGAIAGGHAICLRPPSLVDNLDWWRFYNQGEEGACVAAAWSRHQTLMNRKRYDMFPFYDLAQRIDEWPGENYDGTSVRAGGDVARDHGLWIRRNTRTTGPHPSEGISVNRWAQSVEEIAACLSPADSGRAIMNRGWVEFLNSWGAYYPHYTRIELESLNRLVFRENGDSTCASDR